MELSKINYSDLNGKQKEIYNFQKIASELADYGFNCIKLSDDWHGADFLAYHKDGDETLKIQLKGRLTIDKKYKGKGLYMSFPLNNSWYVVQHDELIKIVGSNTNWLNTESWITKGCYHTAKPSQQLLSELKRYIL